MKEQQMLSLKRSLIVDLYVLYSCDTFITEQKYCINHQLTELYHDPTDSVERKVQRKVKTKLPSNIYSKV